MASFWSSHSAATPEVRVLSRQSVHTASPSPSPTHSPAFFLSCLDTLWRDIHYNRRLLFYGPPARIPPAAAVPGDAERRCSSAISRQLKQSLSRCLVHYFPWCGRLAPAGLDAPGRLVIDCNGGGVEFVEAAIDMPLSELTGDGFQMRPFFDQLSQMPDYTGECLYSSPLLSIQVTFFSDGGFALGVAHSHVVADGHSLWNFMIAWAECARGVPLSAPPLHDRRRLVVRDPSAERAARWRLVPKEGAGADAENGKDASAGQANRHVQSPASAGERESEAEADPLVQCVLELSAAAVKKLKEEAGEGFSSYEVMCAHLWRRSTASRHLPGEACTQFSVLANSRSRLTPPLPPAYFGNAINFAIPAATAGKICSETFSETAARIHGAVTELQANIADFMHYLEITRGSVNEILHIFMPVRGKGHNVGSSPWFPVYEVDFGWGRPAAVRSAKVLAEGEIVFYGGRPGSARGDVEICTALPASVLTSLLDDPLFLPRLPCRQAN